MTFEFANKIPTVGERVDEALARMRLSGDAMPGYKTFLLASLSRAHGMDGTGLQAAEWDKEVTARLERVTRTVLESNNARSCDHEALPEHMLCALAIPDMPRDGVQGISILLRRGPYRDLMLAAQRTHLEYANLARDVQPTKRMYDRLGSDAQLLFQIHAVENCRRALLASRDAPREIGELDDMRSYIAKTARIRGLMSLIDTPLAWRFQSLAQILFDDRRRQPARQGADPAVFNPAADPKTVKQPFAQDGADGSNVIRLDRFRVRPKVS